ncbi:hypothetical protein BGX31_007294 [Mortierella sp. GBA43]|nr:hypothetical protein BGX31_007294 [Mortierella sp. GBA43]
MVLFLFLNNSHQGNNQVQIPASYSTATMPLVLSGSFPPYTSTNNTTEAMDHIFAENVAPPTTTYQLPEPGERLSSTQQLAQCLGLLKSSRWQDDPLEPAAQRWLQATGKDEQERLRKLAVEVVRVFKHDEAKDAKVAAEVVCLAPVLDTPELDGILDEFHLGIQHSRLLNIHHIEGLAQLIQGAGTFSSYLNDFKHSEDPFLVYQAAYAFQALLYIADSESTWVLATTHVEKHNGVVSNPPHITKTSLDPNKFIETLVDMQKTPQQIAEAAAAAEPVYDGVALDQSDGRRLLDCLQEGHCFERKRDWYSALRGADLLIRDGDLASFKTLVCQAPCRLDPAFQWGLCQRLGDLAASPTWDPTTRRSAVVFLGEIYRNDHVWGQHASIKQWILDILMQLALSLGVASTQCMGR